MRRAALKGPEVMSDRVAPALRANASDRARTVLGLLTSSIDLVAPGFGSVFGGLISEVLPNLREKRVEQYLERLARRLAAVNDGLNALAERVDKVSAEHLALIQEGAQRAAESTTDERIERLAIIVADGVISPAQTDAAAARRVLRTLADLDEVELETLTRLAGWCAEGNKGKPLTDKRLSELLVGDYSDNAAWGGYQLAFSRLQALGLIQTGPNGNVVRSYPTTAGELVLLKAGLHPNVNKAFWLAGEPEGQARHQAAEAEKAEAQRRAVAVQMQRNREGRARF
jgi:hypothetical protein